jgi:uncharacterized lipoprotein YmbA
MSPQTLGASADYSAIIEVQRFESALGEAETVDGVWTVNRTKDGRSQTGRTTAREPAPERSYDALAAAHSRATARLCRDIAEAVRTLDGASHERGIGSRPPLHGFLGAIDFRGHRPALRGAR